MKDELWSIIVLNINYYFRNNNKLISHNHFLKIKSLRINSCLIIISLWQKMDKAQTATLISINIISSKSPTGTGLFQSVPTSLYHSSDRIFWFSSGVETAPFKTKVVVRWSGHNHSKLTWFELVIFRTWITGLLFSGPTIELFGGISCSWNDWIKRTWWIVSNGGKRGDTYFWNCCLKQEVSHGKWCRVICCHLNQTSQFFIWGFIKIKCNLQTILLKDCQTWFWGWGWCVYQVIEVC